MTAPNRTTAAARATRRRMFRTATTPPESPASPAAPASAAGLHKIPDMVRTCHITHEPSASEDAERGRNPARALAGLSPSGGGVAVPDRDEAPRCGRVSPGGHAWQMTTER